MIIVDLETSGINPQRCSILSIGAIDFLNPNNQFYTECRIDPGCEINEKSLAISGFSKEQINDPGKKSVQQILEEFFKWLPENRILAGENPFFDKDFLEHAALKYNIPQNIGRRTVDLHTISFVHQLKRQLISLNVNPNLSLDKTLVYVGLPMRHSSHNALVDAKLEAEAFSRLLFNKGLFEEYAAFPVPFG